jgi:hypothetical protein
MMVMLGAANRDPARFQSPGSLELDRPYPLAWPGQ